MNAAGPHLAALVISLAALAGLVALYRTIAARDAWAPLNRRFLFGIRLTMLIFAGRALVILTGVEAFRILILLAAALVPLAVLLLTEALLRRHAPRGAKLWVAAGTGLSCALALAAPWAGQAGLWALMAFQLTGLGLSGALVLRRDRASLSAAENIAAARLALSLVLIMPLAALDFVVPLMGVPIQPSGLAVLFLCWLAIGLGRTDEDHWRSLSGFGAVLAAAVLLTGFLALTLPLSPVDVAVTGAVILAVMLVPAIWRDALEQGDALRDLTLLRHIARAPASAGAFLDGLRAHPLVDGALLLDEADLPELDPDRLRAILSECPVLRRRDAAPDGEAADYAAHLFRRFGASHILLVRNRPLGLLALSMPELSASSRAEIEVDAVQRVAHLLAENG